MENTIKTHENQSILDLAIQHTGTLEHGFALAWENGLSVTEMLTAGRIMKLPNTKNKNEVVSYYKSKNLQPATEVSQSQWALLRYNEGIDYWAIEDNFEVQ